MTGFEPGDLIYRSKPYAYVLDNYEVRGERCDNCFKERDGLKRCSQCSFVYFCDKKCQTNAWKTHHKMECKYLKNAGSNIPVASLRLLANIIFKIKKYGLDEPSETIHGHKMNFRRLVSHVDEIKQHLKPRQAMMTLLGLLKQYIGENNLPSSDELMDIYGKMTINTYSISDDDLEHIGYGIFLGPAIFDHSCEPDAEVVFDGIDLCVRAVKKIPHRDVTKIYVCSIDQLQPIKDRQDFLREQYYFSCQCSRCTSSYHEDLMHKTLIDKNEAEMHVAKFKAVVDVLEKMKKDNGNASAIHKACVKELEKQDGILANTHIWRIKILKLAFDACIENKQWADAIAFGKDLIEPYKLFYGTYHPIVGVHLYKIAKMQHFLGLDDSVKRNLIEAKGIIKVTHGTDHPFYKMILEIIQACVTFQTHA